MVKYQLGKKTGQVKRMPDNSIKERWEQLGVSLTCDEWPAASWIEGGTGSATSCTLSRMTHILNDALTDIQAFPNSSPVKPREKPKLLVSQPSRTGRGFLTMGSGRGFPLTSLRPLGQVIMLTGRFSNLILRWLMMQLLTTLLGLRQEVKSVTATDRKQSTLQTVDQNGDGAMAQGMGSFDGDPDIHFMTSLSCELRDLLLVVLLPVKSFLEYLNAALCIKY